MTFSFIDPFDAIGFAVERLKETGVEPQTIIEHNKDLVEGKILVSRDRPGKKPFVCLAAPETPFVLVKKAIGL